MGKIIRMSYFKKIKNEKKMDLKKKKKKRNQAF